METKIIYAKTIRKMLDDANVSDDEIFKMILELFKDNHRPTTEEHKLNDLIEKKRPNVIKMLTDYVIDGHKDCCIPTVKKD